MKFEVKEAGVMHFDGACKAKTGGGGYIIWDSLGNFVHAGSSFFGKNTTNNESEAQAMLLGLEYIQEHASETCTRWVIRGDSALIINFMNKKNVPKKKSLVKLVLAARKIV